MMNWRQFQMFDFLEINTAFLDYLYACHYPYSNEFDTSMSSKNKITEVYFCLFGSYSNLFTSGCGEPCPEHSIWPPVLLENSTLWGGSCENTGPCKSNSNVSANKWWKWNKILDIGDSMKKKPPKWLMKCKFFFQLNFISPNEWMVDYVAITKMKYTHIYQIKKRKAF